MQLDELIGLAESGLLSIEKKPYRNYTRRQYKYDWNNPKDDEKVTRKPDVKYTRYTYLAQTLDMQCNEFYKITAKNYDILLKAGAKIL